MSKSIMVGLLPARGEEYKGAHVSRELREKAEALAKLERLVCHAARVHLDCMENNDLLTLLESLVYKAASAYRATHDLLKYRALALDPEKEKVGNL